MNFHRQAITISYTRAELKDILRQVNSDYTRELNVNGLTGKLEDLERQKAILKTQINKGIYL